MGYCHYWGRHREIDPPRFSLIVSDFKRSVLALDDMGVRLAGPLGTGLPEIGSEAVSFNGVQECGHVRNEEICIPFPAPDASGIGDSNDAVVRPYSFGVEIRHRTCDGRCDYETFSFERVVTGRAPDQARDGWYLHSCKTGFRPYDLAVQCFLLICKHRIQDEIHVQSGGSDFHWNESRSFCYAYLGYPLGEFAIDKEAGLIRRTALKN